MVSLLTFRSRSIDLLAWCVIFLFVWSVTAFGQTQQVVLGTQQVEPPLATVNASTSCPCTIWSPGTTPSTASAADKSAVELGVKFNSTQNGFIAGVRFYKGAGNTGTHVGNLWSSTGTLLASVTFTNEMATGWQQANFSTPVAINANTTYVVSYFAPVGGYAYNSNYFTSAVTNGPLSALANGVNRGNGVYVYSANSSFPTSTYNATNYWVDVVFETSSNGAPVAVNDSYSSIEGQTLTVAAPGVLSNDSSPGGLSLTAHQLGNPANGTAALNANGSFTYTPNAGFTGSDSFTYQASDGSLNSNTATVTITVNALSCPCTIWSPSTTPSTASAADKSAVELGVKFNSTQNGFIAGVRFYKGAGNTGTHVGNLWSSTGTLLASVTFTNEMATGWQQANFSTPVAINANTTYVVSYFAPVGGYAYNSNYFTSAVTNGPLSALANGVNRGNGVYVYSANSSFPTSTYNAANYWVDVVFDVSQRVQVSISPTTVRLSTGAKQQFAASVSGSTNTAVTWAASGGTITSGGLYTAPSSAGTYSVTATSAADSTKSASATVTVSQPSQVSISVSPNTASVSTGAQKQFTASVSGSTNTAVTWQASSGTVSSSGLYTAPSSAGTYSVTATSAADSTKSASATVTVSQPQVSISVSPNTASVSTGGQEQFAANVSGTSNTAVTWSASGGTVSTTGLYVAPGTAGTYTVVAVSAADPTKSASATVSVSAPAPISVSVSPNTVAMPQKWQQQFTATVSGTSNTTVTWSVKQGSGTITQSGLYTAPQAVETDVITATSQADSTKSASASVSVVAPHTVSLNWSPSTSTGISYYKVYRGTVSGGPYSLLATNVSVTSYTDSNVQSGRTYYYVTTAVDSSGVESGYSDIAPAVIPMP
jgi:hypothetical protein